MNAARYLLTLLILTACSGLWVRNGCSQTEGELLRETVITLSSLGTRSTGSAGYEKAAAYIRDNLTALGLEVNSFKYRVPARISEEAFMEIGEVKIPLATLSYNAITPTVLIATETKPLIYAGQGTLEELNGKNLAGAIVLLDSESGKNWQIAASAGASAAILLDDSTKALRWQYKEKEELSPLQFPLFWMERNTGKKYLDKLLDGDRDAVLQVKVSAHSAWKPVVAENLYAFIKGNDPDLQKQLLIFESSFDTDEFIAGVSPGADAASSIATFLSIARSLVASPPRSSVLLLATSGSAQALAGLREAVWSISAKSSEFKEEKARLQTIRDTVEKYLEALDSVSFPISTDPERDKVLAQAIASSLDTAVDDVSRELMQLRLAENPDSMETDLQSRIKNLATERLHYRRLGWAEHFHDLPPPENRLLEKVIPVARKHMKKLRSSVKEQLKTLKSAKNFRDSVREYDVSAVVSLLLSSHGNGIGAFNQGWLYNLKPTINRTPAYSKIADLLDDAGQNQFGKAHYRDTLRPSHMRSWESWFLDTPYLGGEVAALAGQLGISLVTTGDGRHRWGTPADTPDAVDFAYLSDQAALTAALVNTLANADTLSTGSKLRNGFAAVSGRANLLLQGELFADYPAADTTILAYQGMNRFYSMVDETGMFHIKGVADKKHSLDKLIIEGYRFDKQTGQVVWAIDKKETGKDNYRLKILRRSMKTDLVLFTCHQTTIFDLLEPRNFNYMTKLYLYDGRRDAPPQHFWYSRIDTKNSIISSIYTEPGTRLKLTLSDTVLTNKMLLTNADEEHRLGQGFLVDNYPSIPHTIHRAAHDSWTLLTPRIDNLDKHGIHDERINKLRDQGLAALANADKHLALFDYTTARKEAGDALALAARVYSQVEKTQKDVLFGVLFYIALFVPFAFVMERFLFNYANIYKQILGFSAILFLLITIIYQVHPAFELAYSPMVVILAFFIIGLSFIVTLIIFFRFEDEMILLQRRASHKRVEEISRWKAFVAAFFLGVSNLRRRKIRSILTATTLIILTFTIMSFTTIKSGRMQVNLPFQPTAPYQGLLLKKLNGNSLPNSSLEILVAQAGNTAQVSPRFWLESSDISRPVIVPLQHNGNASELKGVLGLTAQEAQVTGIDRLLSTGRWFSPDDKNVIILPDEIANQLSIKQGGQLTLWGREFTLIGTFSADTLASITDLDGEIITPVIYPEEAGREVSEEEQEAMESGDDVRSVQSRYRHIPPGQVGIIPARTIRALGGKLKNVAMRIDNPEAIAEMASMMSDRFYLAVFAGSASGVQLYNISDTMQYSGVPNIIIPLLISVLIVLNTMISSVYERKNEIAVYTSVGLAPSHVAFLFVAEAMALAVVSAVFGYLVAQVSASLLSTTPLWAGITVNYSSLAGVAAMVLVIIVVLLSVIYPARVAAKIAIPDVNQTFRLPKPQDSRIRVTLPFLMKYREKDSIGGFIHEYLESHREISHGLFSTGAVQVVESCSIEDFIASRDSHGQHGLAHCLHLRANMWLAPFDFGIMQEVDIQFCPASEGADFLEIQLSLHRLSGEDTVWQRLNTGFLHEVRKQLLIWRSLDNESHLLLQQTFQQTLTGSPQGTGPSLQPTGDAI